MFPKISPKINSVLSEIRQNLAESLSSASSSDTTDELDSFIAETVRNLVSSTNFTEDEALALVLDLAEAGAEVDLLPPLPSLDADEGQIREWIAAATNVDFTGKALAEARLFIDSSSE